MNRRLASTLTALLLLFAVSIPAAHALLERVGPVNNTPSVGGYPAWYQDTTGLTLEFCDPKNTAEVAGGYCLLLSPDVPNPPEVFPTSFFDEHFYFAAGATLTAANAGKATLVLAVEGAFAVGPPVPGDQITFSRIRVKLTNVPLTGTYKFIHPYGEELLDGVQGGVIFFTDDIGIGARGDFSGALSSRLGPFLLASNTPGGPELAGVPGPSGLYIADPGRLGPVTGSPVGTNIFRIEGPAGSGLGGPGVDFIETTAFSLMGRILTTAIPGRVDVSRASYTRNASGQKVDVFATAFETVQGRVPTQPRPPAVTPVLSFFDAPCTATLDAAGNPGPPFSAPAVGTETQMFASPSNFWGQTQPAAIPLGVCVKDGSARDASGAIVPAYFPKAVTDEVTITQALYDGTSRTLTVAATSSDAVTVPTLTLPLLVGATPAPGSGDLVPPATSWTVTPLAAPPAKVRVLSSFGGSEELKVTTAFGVGTPPPGIPVANNDAFTFAEDAAAQTLAVLVNDANAAGGTVTLVAAPRLGTAVANGGTVTYTPNLNAFGNDSFTYTVTVGTTTSNVANVAITLTPVNDPPVAIPDSFTAVANIASTLNVTANDTDPDGAADIVAVASVSGVTPVPPTPGTGTATAVGKNVSFTATAAGIYTFTYVAQDAAVALSNPTTVTVTVASAETVTIQVAEFRRNGGRYRVSGTIAPAAGQTMTIEMLNTAGTVLRTDTVPSTAGTWALDIRNISLPTGANRVRVTSSNGTVQTATLVIRQ